jgi:protein-S-isoprenylcysteine O-methyltransferase Ste14
MSDATPRKSLADNPWYWVYLFCTAALVMLVVAEPKLAEMMAQDHNKAAGRERAWQQSLGEKPSAALATADEMKRVLRPFYIGLAVVLIVAWIIFWRQHFYRQHPAPQQTQHQSEALR